MALHAAIAVPAAPLVLPAASPAQPAEVAGPLGELREEVDAALTTLPERGTAVLLATGQESLLPAASLATLASYGLPDVRTEITVDDALLTAIGSRGQAPRLQCDTLDGDLAVLALLVAAARPALAVVPVTIPAGADAPALDAVAAGLTGAIGASERPVGVVAAGDLAATLSTTSPGYLVAGAERFDEQVVAAVRSADVDALVGLGASAAERVQARGWAPLVVLLRIAAAAGRFPRHVGYHAPRGVGQLVAA